MFQKQIMISNTMAPLVRKIRSNFSHTFYGLIFFLGFLFVFANVKAQQNTVLQLKDAVLKLKEAEDKFGMGHFEEASSITNELLNDNGLTRIEREQALLIAAKINLELDKTDTVDARIVSLLRLSPNYKVNPLTVQQDLLKFFQKYYVIPRVSISIQANRNTAYFKQVNPYKIMSRIEDNSAYGLDARFGGGLKAFYSFRYHFLIGLGVELNEFAYTRELKGPDNLKISYSEKLSFIEIPLTLGKRFTLSNRYNVFGSCLVTGAKMLVQSSLANISSNYPIYVAGSLTEVLEEGVLEQKSINRLDERNDLYRFGVAFELSKQFDDFMFGLGAGYHFTNDLINNTEKRYSNENLLYNYNYLDDDFKFEYLQIYFTASYTLKYSIKKKILKVS